MLAWVARALYSHSQTGCVQCCADWNRLLGGGASVKMTDRANGAECDDMARDQRRMLDRTPNTNRLLGSSGKAGPLTEAYMYHYRKAGSAAPGTVDVDHVIGILLDEQWEGRDIPDEIAKGILALLEVRQ